MKKIFLVLLIVNPLNLCARGGDVAAGLIGGTALGMMAGSVMASSNSRSKADRVEDKLDQMRLQREQDEKLEQARREMHARQELERRLQEHDQARMHEKMNNSRSESSVLYMLIALILLLLLSIIGLAVIVFRGKNNGNRPF
jgi:Flp pilus assembly protein TadB